MANKTIKLAFLAASVMAATSANASTISADFSVGNETVETISVEGSTVIGGVAVSAADEGVTVTPNVNYNQDDRVTFTLSDGKWSNRSTMQLWTGKDSSSKVIKTTVLNGNDPKVLVFRLNQDVPVASGRFLLRQGDAKTHPSFTIKNVASAALVTLGYGVKTQISSSFDIDSIKAATILKGVKQVYASIGTKYNAKISLIDERKKLLDTAATTKDTAATTKDTAATTKDTAATTKDTMTIKLPKLADATLGGVNLSANDKFDVVVNSSDMTGIKNLVLGNKTVTPVNNTVTFSGLSYSAGIASSTLNVVANVDGETNISAKSFTASVTVKLDKISNQAVISNASAGSWTVDELEAIVSSMSLNATGFVSWLKVVNEGKVSGDIVADITWTNGSENGVIKKVNLGKAEAQKIGTISEAQILKAINKHTAEGVVEVSLHLTIDAPLNEVHIVSEKKASNGRLTTPVYYKGRTFGQ